MTAREIVGSRAESLVGPLAKHTGVEGIVLYGSVARGDDESHSDVDILVLCSTLRKRPLLEALNSSVQDFGGNLSLTLYTRRELQFLARVRSLFLLHLSRESITLLDRSGGFLQSLLKNFTPKASYAEDFEKALDLLEPLQTVVHGTPNQCHRLTHAYSLYRVFGVYLLAEKGVYEFSKQRMSENLCVHYPSASPAVHTLSPLRAMNNSFFSRSGQLGEMLPWARQGNIRTYISALFSLTGAGVVVQEKEYGAAVEDFVGAARSRRGRLSYGLRAWFLLLVYDGLNMFCQKEGLPPLIGFAEDNLILLSSPGIPGGARSAAGEVLSYMRSYPLKYFLDRGRGLDTSRAEQVLSDLARVTG